MSVGIFSGHYNCFNQMSRNILHCFLKVLIKCLYLCPLVKLKICLLSRLPSPFPDAAIVLHSEYLPARSRLNLQYPHAASPPQHSPSLETLFADPGWLQVYFQQRSQKFAFNKYQRSLKFHASEIYWKSPI